MQSKFTRYLLRVANTSIDISDGLIVDLTKMINKQNLSFQINENKIPTSSKLTRLIKTKKFKKINLISNGDDYQILFTAKSKKTRIIQNISRFTGIKISKIGKIISGKNRSMIINEKGRQIVPKIKGYLHKF